MSEIDEWGRSPAVQRMRKIFSRMEKAQEELLKQLKIRPFDKRLGRVRKDSKDFYELTYSLACRRDWNLSDEKIVTLYLYCLAWALDLAGIRVSGEILPKDERLTELVREALT